MIVEKEIRPSNMKVAGEKVHYSLNGVVLHGKSKLVFEFLSERDRTPYLSVFNLVREYGKSKIVTNHSCTAIRTGQGCCWHLAAAYRCFDALEGGGVSNVVEVTEEYMKPLIYGGKDCTVLLTGKQGKFSKLVPKEVFEVPADVEVEPVKEYDRIVNLHRDDQWVAEIGLPPKLLERVLAFRRSQRVLLMSQPENLVRIPNLGGVDPKETMWAEFVQDIGLVKKVEYIPAGREVMQALSPLLYDNWNPVLFSGAASTGKTYLAYYIARILMLPVTVLSGNANTNEESLLGFRDLKPLENGQMMTVHVPGSLLEPIQQGGLLVFNEINQALPDVLSILNDVLDWQKRTYVTGIGEIRVAENFRLIATRNIGYVGTSDLNQALCSRFHDVKMNYPSPETIEKVLASNVPTADCGVLRNIAAIYNKLKRRVESGELDQDVISIRSLIRAAEESTVFGGTKEVVFDCLQSGIYDSNALSVIGDIVEAHFGG